MTTTNILRVQWVLGRVTAQSVPRSAKWLSKETGIPQSTISYVRRGIRDLPKKYNAVMRNQYQREAYLRLGNEGASSYQAKRFSWYNTIEVQTHIDTLLMKVNDLTLGHIGARYKSIGRPVTENEVMEVWKEEREQTVISLQHSKKSLESIYAYGGT